jgi:hypothetical protein
MAGPLLKIEPAKAYEEPSPIAPVMRGAYAFGRPKMYTLLPSG